MAAINIQDVTPDVWQILGLKTDASASDKSNSSAATLTDHPAAPQNSPAPAPILTDTGSSPLTPVNAGTAPTPPPTPVQAYSAPHEINTATASGVEVINAISNFVTSGAHVISQPGAMNFSNALTQELAGYFAGGNSLKIIVFDSTAPIADIFSFSPGVVFVADKDFTPNAILSNHGGNLTLDTTGGTITLVGVATIDHASA